VVLADIGVAKAELVGQHDLGEVLFVGLRCGGVGAKAVGVGRFYLYPLAAAGQAGVERALGLMRAEIERGMKLMGCASIGQLSRGNLRFR